jgi:hypothetical protein
VKKTIITSASLIALAAAAPALAQSTSPRDQTGTGNAATVSQAGANSSDVDQTGDDNITDVEQSGSGNTSDIDQNSLGALADVSQTGVGNSSVINQVDGSTDSSTGVVPQDPEAFVVQNGNNNQSTVDQNAVAPSYNLVTSVTQTGDDNVSDVQQSIVGNIVAGSQRAIVTQSGNADSLVDQNSTNFAARNMDARVNQEDSVSTILQTPAACTRAVWMPGRISAAGRTR